jgi:GDP-L-fucose synthase
MINKNSRIYVAGHTGLVGSAIIRFLNKKGYKKIITANRLSLNLLDQNKVYSFIKTNKPEAIIIAAAKVGGININSICRADFIYENLTIQNNLINSAHQNNINNLIFLGSSCVYPRNCKQPIKEKYLLSGYLEKTNEPYAIAKIAGIKMCESYNFQYNRNYKCLMPSNVYGPNDNYDLKNSHFFSALIKKIHYAKTNKKKIIILWGSGKAKRELLFSDDLAEACIFFLKKKTKETLINIGVGKDYTIEKYAKFILKKLNLDIKINFDLKKPDGMPRKLLDTTIAKKYGWKAKTTLIKGFDITYKDYLYSNID